jgi:regulator of protease activity HflC (stomatin/prohibitin superfamily)
MSERSERSTIDGLALPIGPRFSWAQTMRTIPLLLMLSSGCTYFVDTGHLALLVKPSTGPQHHPLEPGRHYIGFYDRVHDFDVTYSTREEELHTISSEGLAMDVKVAIIYRPIKNELYDLDVEVGPKYYDEVVGPEFRTATRGVFARHSYLEVQKINEKLEDEIEAEMRRRVAGKHVEINSVTMEAVDYAPEIAAAVRSKLVGEQEAIRKKVAQEAEAARQKLELEHEAERERLKTEAEIRQKEKERKLAEEQAAIDRVQAETEAATRVTRAKAEAQAISTLADAKAKEKRAEAVALTPLMVQMHAYDALAKLGGSGANIMLGDWSHVPNFLFPGFGSWRSNAAQGRASLP